jgi:hypothetical protein
LSFSARGLAGAAPSVECRVPSDPDARVYRLEQQSSGGKSVWQLSMRRRESGARWIRLALPNAAPTIGDGTASLLYRNGNGGREVMLDVKPGAARLSVFVDYGLDVNIEPDLDPDVDHMNTGGPLTSVDCTVTAGPGV